MNLLPGGIARSGTEYKSSTIDCTVRSLSATGGGLAVSSTAGVPDAFKLQIEADGVYRTCHIVTKTDRYIEIAFG